MDGKTGLTRCVGYVEETSCAARDNPNEARCHSGTVNLGCTMNHDPHAVHISVDGSCYPHQGRRSGYAGIVVYPDDPNPHEVLFQGFKESTINRMKLAACIAAMEWVREEQIGVRYERVLILSDSQYVINGQRSAPYWQKAKWRTSARRPIENSDL